MHIPIVVCKYFITIIIIHVSFVNLYAITTNYVFNVRAYLGHGRGYLTRKSSI